MSVLDVPRSPIASPFASDGRLAALFATLDSADTTTPADRTVMLLGDSTGNQTDEWFSLGWQAVMGLWPIWRVLYYGFNDGTTSWPTPTILNAGTPVGTPAPVDGVVASDDGSGSGELSGSTSSGGQLWEGPGGYQVRSGGKITSNGAGLFDTRMLVPARGEVTYTAQLGVINQGSSTQTRVQIYRDSSNYARINIIGSTTKTITLVVVLAGTARTVATFASGAIPGGAAYAEYAMSLGFTLTKDGSGNITGGNLAGLINTTAASGALTADEATMLAGAERITYGSNSASGTIDAISVAVKGISTAGPYKTLHIYNGSVSGTRLDYQTSDTNAARRAVLLAPNPGVVFLSAGHNYDLDTPAVFFGKVDDAVAKIQANVAGSPEIVITSQNPEFLGSVATAPKAAAHNVRQLAVRQHALAAGWGYVPGFEPYASRVDGGKYLIDPDGIHPRYGSAMSVAQGNGSIAWADTFTQYLRSKSSRA